MTVAPATTDADAPEARAADLRLATLHLRMGRLELARAELESFAGRGVLDRQALLDLAEVRWRTGDLPGAGVAASAYLGGNPPRVLALVIAAEAAAGVGHPGDARRLAQEALDLLEAGDPPEGPDALGPLFAGMPQSQVWPIRPHFRVEPAGLLFVAPGAPGRRAAESRAGVDGGPDAGLDGPAGGDEAVSTSGASTDGAEDRPTVDAEHDGPGLWDESPASAIDDAVPVSEIAEARAAMAAGDHAEAAARLGELLRRRPELAGSVLAALAASPDDAGLASLDGSPEPAVEDPEDR